MMEKNFLNPATNKQWRIEIDGHTIRTCLNGGKVKEILCDSAFQVKSKAASAMMGQMRRMGMMSCTDFGTVNLSLSCFSVFCRVLIKLESLLYR